MGELTQLDALKPAALREGMYSVRIDVTDSAGLTTVSIESFVVYDGLAPKVVSRTPNPNIYTLAPIFKPQSSNLQPQSSKFKA